jgi:hypothetical protein
MPDGSRKRRFSINPARRRWYAIHRSQRFSRRFGLVSGQWRLASRVSFVLRAIECQFGV